MFYSFLFIFKEKKIIITFKLQLSWGFNVVLMYRIHKLCSDAGVRLLQRYAWAIIAYSRFCEMGDGEDGGETFIKNIIYKKMISTSSSSTL